MAPHVALTRYQKFVVLAAWLGLGFDMMEGLLFNFISPLVIPDLFDLPAGTPETRQAIVYWTGILTSVMLVGWTLGGIVFGWLSDRIGRARTVIITILLYSLGTAAGALAPGIGVFAICRFIAAIGIGGEWAAGATLVAETVPETRRVAMGTLLATAGIAGGFIALFATRVLTGEVSALAARPDLAWRVVMAVGLLPAGLAFVLRRKLREPSRWTEANASGRTRPSLRALFSPALRRRTIGAAVIATLTLVTMWATTSFLPAMASFMAEEQSAGLSPGEATALRASFVSNTMFASSMGALAGILLGAPIAERFGRRPLYLASFAVSAITLVITFALDWSPTVRMLLVASVAVPIGSATGSFYYYLTELYPLELRGTGASFCMNAGRFITVLGPVVVGSVANAGVPVRDVLTGTAIVPLVGALLVAIGVGVETKGKPLDG